MGTIAVHIYGEDSWKDKLVILSYSSHDYFYSMLPAFYFAKIQVYGIDPPGSGYSTGGR